MTSYVLAHFKVEDADGYAAYVKGALPTIAAFGGRTVVADDSTVDLWYDRPGSRAIMIRFPTRKDARRWLDSEEYGEVKEDRARATDTFSLLLFDELP